ncbi:MAG: cysteine desulfurase [Oscillospiraceae bacterium]|nr:cysteine desulfurase [Oscillospiraceae bacterium]
MIYFDNASTTCVLPEAADAAVSAMCENFGNPSSLHGLGISAEKLVKSAKETVAASLHCSPREIFFTSCGSESNNLAIFGAAARSGKKKHFITTTFEHPSVLECAKRLESQGFEVTYIEPRPDGVVLPADVAEAVREDTFLVSVMSVNNEVGSVMDISAIAKAVHIKNRETLIHTDAVQAFGKIPIDTRRYGADIISISGHKIHAPKGIGAIYIRNGVRLAPQLLGGGQEGGLRSGTEAVAQIAAFEVAVRAAVKDLSESSGRMRELTEKLISSLELLPGVHVFAPRERAPHILSVAFSKYPSEVIMRLLEEGEIYVSAGSACSRGKKSHVLRALGVPDHLIGSAVRISLSRFSTEEEVGRFIDSAREKLI